MAKITSPIVLPVGDDNDRDAEADAPARESTSSDDGQGPAAASSPDEVAPLDDDQDAAATSRLDDGAPEALQLANDRTPLADIKESADLLRPIDDEHVQLLVIDISERSLLAPILVDWDNRVIDGHHRLAALRKIKAGNSALFETLFHEGLVPVRRVDKDEHTDPQRILGATAAANVLRLPLNEEDILRWYDRLVTFGHPSSRGRPSKSGKRAVGAILKEMFGISDTTYARLLAKRRVNNSPGGGITATKKPRAQHSPDEKILAAEILPTSEPGDSSRSGRKGGGDQANGPVKATPTVPDDDGDHKVGAVEGNSQSTDSFTKRVDHTRVDVIMAEIRKLTPGELDALAHDFEYFRVGLDRYQRHAAS